MPSWQAGLDENVLISEELQGNIQVLPKLIKVPFVQPLLAKRIIKQGVRCKKTSNKDFQDKQEWRSRDSWQATVISLIGKDSRKYQMTHKTGGEKCKTLPIRQTEEQDWKPNNGKLPLTKCQSNIRSSDLNFGKRKRWISASQAIGLNLKPVLHELKWTTMLSKVWDRGRKFLWLSQPSYILTRSLTWPWQKPKPSDFIPMTREKLKLYQDRASTAKSISLNGRYPYCCHHTSRVSLYYVQTVTFLYQP